MNQSKTEIKNDGQVFTAQDDANVKNAHNIFFHMKIYKVAKKN